MIGACLKDPDAVDRVISGLEDIDFYTPKHQVIFRAIKDVYSKGEPPDITTVGDKLRTLNQLKSVGGFVYLVELVEEIASIANLKYHIKMVKDKSTLRKIIRTSNEIAQNCYDGQSPADEILNKAESDIFQLTNISGKLDVAKAGSYFDDVLAEIQDFQTGQSDKHCYKYGFTDLDSKIFGLFKGDLIYVAANTSDGKTQFLLQVLTHLSSKLNIPTGILSLEMTARALAMRILGIESKLSITSMRREGELNAEDHRKLSGAANKLYDMNLFIEPSSFLSAVGLISKARQLKSKHNIGVLGIDYLQLMSSGIKNQNREREISFISATLKGIAKELNIPVIGLSQLSRENVKMNREPRKSDLRDSGSLEQDADVLLMPYLRRNKVSKKVELAKIIIEKVRMGDLGYSQMSFIEGRWENYVPELNF